MRKKIVIGLGATTAVIALSTGVSAALAASAGPHQQARVTTAAAHSKITRAQAAKIAKAKVPHSHVIEIESDDRHDRAVWKVKLGTPHGRVVVDVDKKTGKATIVKKSGPGDGGHGDGVGAMTLSAHRSGHDSARDAREDRHHQGDHDGRHHRGDDRDRDGRGHDGGDN
jgi:Peptidase propeptide and YPEB domain